MASGASGTAEAGHEVGVADEPVAEARPALRDDRGARTVVRLGDQHAGRAGPRADPAAGAEVDGAVRAQSAAERPARGSAAACGPTYFGPGKSSVTRATGQTVVHTLHLMQASVLNGGNSRAAASWNVMRPPPGIDASERGRAMRAGERHAVAAPLVEVAHAGQRRADDAHVLELRAASSWSSTAMPAASSGWGRSGSSLNHESRAGATTGRPKTRSTSVPSWPARIPAPAMPPVARTNASAAETQGARRRLGVDRRHPPARALDAGPRRSRSGSARRTPGSGAGAPRTGAGRAPKAAGSAISKTRCPSAASASAWTSACRSRPRTAGMPMRHVARRERGTDDGQGAAPPRGVVEQARQALRPRLWSRSIVGKLDVDARGPRRGRRAMRRSRGCGPPRRPRRPGSGGCRPGRARRRPTARARPPGRAAGSPRGGATRWRSGSAPAGRRASRRAPGPRLRFEPGEPRRPHRRRRRASGRGGHRFLARRRMPSRGVVAPSGAATSRPPCVQCVVAMPLAATNTLAPASASSAAHDRPASPAPMTTTSARGTVDLGLRRARHRPADPRASVPRKMPAVSHSSAS